jgi:hypothetical protein
VGGDQWFCFKTLKCCGYESTNVVIGIYPLTHLFDPHLDLRSMKSELAWELCSWECSIRGSLF